MTDGVTTRIEGSQVICSASVAGQVTVFEYWVDNPSTEDSGLSWIVILIIILSVVAVAVMIIIIVICCVKKRRQRKNISQRLQKNTSKIYS